MLFTWPYCFVEAMSERFPSKRDDAFCLSSRRGHFLPVGHTGWRVGPYRPEAGKAKYLVYPVILSKN
jgi:hypothetical protein